MREWYASRLAAAATPPLSTGAKVARAAKLIEAQSAPATQRGLQQLTNDDSGND
jgi:hypothetical protein